MASERCLLRKQFGISKAHAGKLAGVSTPTVTLYEADPTAVGDVKRAALDRVYAGFAEFAKAVAA